VSYQFSLIRFVPDPARGEFVNIGAVVGDDEARDWDLRLISNLRRARALDRDGVLPAALGFVAHLDQRVGAIEQPPYLEPEPLTVDWLRRTSQEMQNIIQLSTPAPLVADSTEAALDLIFGELVVDPEAQEFRFEKKHRAQRSARVAYRAHEIPREAVEERAKVSSGVYGDTFDFAVHNGRAVQLVQCWSFQLPNQNELAEQVRSWSWVVHELRRGGGVVGTAGGELEISEGAEIAAICILPREGGEFSAYAEAQDAFTENRVTQLTPEEADGLGARAAQLLGAVH
jgi:hypothetical protein